MARSRRGRGRGMSRTLPAGHARRCGPGSCVSLGCRTSINDHPPSAGSRDGVIRLPPAGEGPRCPVLRRSGGVPPAAVARARNRHGCGSGAGAGRARTGEHSRRARPGGGRGLAGMRECVRVLRGDLVAGAGEREWRVAAPLPLQSIRDDVAMIKLLLVDDEELERTGLRAILDAEPDITVVGEASDGAEVPGLVRRLAPEVVLMDVRMAAVDGIAATRHLLTKLPKPPRVLVLTDVRQRRARLRRGASGCHGFPARSGRGLPRSCRRCASSRAASRCCSRRRCGTWWPPAGATAGTGCVARA